MVSLRKSKGFSACTRSELLSLSLRLQRKRQAVGKFQFRTMTLVTHKETTLMLHVPVYLCAHVCPCLCVCARATCRGDRTVVNTVGLRFHPSRTALARCQSSPSSSLETGFLYCSLLSVTGDLAHALLGFSCLHVTLITKVLVFHVCATMSRFMCFWDMNWSSWLCGKCLTH